MPRAELEGDMTDQQMGLQARLMSKALRKITGTYVHTYSYSYVSCTCTASSAKKILPSSYPGSAVFLRLNIFMNSVSCWGLLCVCFFLNAICHFSFRLLSFSFFSFSPPFPSFSHFLFHFILPLFPLIINHFLSMLIHTFLSTFRLLIPCFTLPPICV